MTCFCCFFFSFLYCRLGMVREKVEGEAKGKMHGQLFCSHKTKNHHKLKCFQVKLEIHTSHFWGLGLINHPLMITSCVGPLKSSL